MTEQETFEHLFEVAKTSKDTRGVVAAALVERGKILVSCPSSHDGVEHAEYRVLQEAAKRGIRIHNQHFLFVTVVPCGKRNPKGKGGLSWVTVLQTLSEQAYNRLYMGFLILMHHPVWKSVLYLRE